MLPLRVNFTFSLVLSIQGTTVGRRVTYHQHVTLTCNHRGKKGHISPACHSKMKELPPVQNSGPSENHGQRKPKRHETIRVQLETQSVGSSSVSKDQASSEMCV